MTLTGWQRLRYGTAVVVGITAGGTLWFNETRRTVEARDVIELLEGLEERHRAAYYNVPHTDGVVTQSVARWITDPSGETWSTYAGTTTVSTAAYLYRSGTTNVTYTNSVQSSFDFYTPVTITTGRFVWAGWDELTPSGFPVQFGTQPPNGETLYAAGYYGGWGYWTQAAVQAAGVTNWLIIDKGPATGWHMDFTTSADSNTPPSSWALNGFFTEWSSAANDETVRTNWSGSLVGAVTATVAAASLSTNAIRDAAARVSYTRLQSITRTSSPSNFWYTFDGVLTNLIPQYVDSIGETGNVVYLTVTGLFDTLSIGDGTSQFTRTPAIGTNAATYGGVGRIVREIHVEERYKILHALTQTVASASWSTNRGSIAVSNVAATADTYTYTPPEPQVSTNYPDLPTNGVPVAWLDADEVTQDQTKQGAFWSNNVPSRTYDGKAAGASNALTFGASEAPSYTYSFQYDWKNYQSFETDLDGSQYELTDARVDFGGVSGVDTSHWRRVDAVPQIVIAADLTGTTYTAEQYVQIEAKTNNLAATWFATGNYSVAATWATNIPAYPLTSRADWVTVPYDDAAVVNTNAGEALLLKSYTSLGSPNPWEFVARHESATNLAAGIQYGWRWKLGPTLLRWEFTRCENPLP